jgi:hypothetical protein
MDRAPRTARRPLRLLALLAAAPVFVAAPWAFAQTADSEGPTVNFTATGAVPLACGSHPNVSSLQVKAGTRIVFANLIDTTAALTVGGEKVTDLGPGTGAVVRLEQGQHEVRLLPQCVVVTRTDAVVVSVLAGSDGHESASRTGDPTTPEEPPAVPAQPRSSGGASVPAAVSAAPSGTSGPGPSSGTSLGAPGGPGAPATTVTAPTHPAAGSADAPLESAVIDVQRIRLGNPRDPKGGRLLAVIAAICVIGVTAAIIRAIVSQRTSSAVSP